MLDPDYEDLLPLLSVPAAQHDPGPTGVTPTPLPPGHPRHHRSRDPRAAPAGPTRPSPPRSRPPTASSSWSCWEVATTGSTPSPPSPAPTGPATRRSEATWPSRPPSSFPPPAATGSTLVSPSCGRATPPVGSRSSGASGSPPTTCRTSPRWPPSWPAPPRPPASSGWLGRYLDGISEFDSGMRGITFSSSVPLHLLGQRAKVTAVPDQGGMWGSDPTERWERSAFAAVQAYAATPTGLSAWGDRVAANGKAAIGMAQTINTLYAPDLTATGLARDLTLAARLINANLGTRVIGVSVGGWDTHSNQLYDHGELLGELDAGIEAFFTTLAPGFRDQTTLATFSEFGRRPERNDSGGTDHGTSNVLFVVGENVRGGLHGAQPSLTALDSPRELRPHRRLPVRLRDPPRPVARRRPRRGAGRHLRAARPLHQRAGRAPHPSATPAAAQPGQAVRRLDRPRPPAVRRPAARRTPPPPRWPPGSAASSAPRRLPST